MGKESGLTCRHCGRPIAVPASRCPWCDRQIMIVCAACKQYTDDSLPTCQRCGAPLQPASREEIRQFTGVPPEVAELLADKERARLIASGVVAQYLPGFFYDDGTHRTVLVELFGRQANRLRRAAALLFAAVAHLVHHGYCDLRGVEGRQEMEWVEVRRWDGQVRCLEGRLAKQAGVGLTVGEALHRAIQEEMGFGFEVIRPSRTGLPGGPRIPTVRDRSERPPLTAVIQAGRRAVLPDHEESAACAEVYRTLLAFVRADPDRARRLAQTVLDTLEWFRQYEEDPSLALME